uniref:Translocating chain-associated membrane protein 1-like 1 n=1 Tax=Sinocyclocheilus anshuiensis TaxID=1608454 RepID=A0A671MXI3_9TELE
MGIRKKSSKNPPVLSHEFVIQNHADIVSCVAMVFLLGLMFEITSKVAVLFITVQYNVTIPADGGPEETTVNYFHYGLKDVATVFFYMLVAIIMHAIIQEYVLDCFGATLLILINENLLSNPVSLWDGYPHTLMLFQMKFYYICQLGYWLHAIPELYFQKAKKEDIPRQLVYISLYLVHITGAYVLNLNRLALVLLVLHYFVELLFHVSRLIYFSNEDRQTGFTVWAVLFVLGRLLTLSLSVLTVGFGLAGAEKQGLNLAEGSFNVLFVRVTVLAAICTTQAFMMWKFINFQLRQWREHAQTQTLKKKPSSSKSKSKKANGVNGSVGASGADSPRARKEKSS